MPPAPAVPPHVFDLLVEEELFGERQAGRSEGGAGGSERGCDKPCARQKRSPVHSDCSPIPSGAQAGRTILSGNAAVGGKFHGRAVLRRGCEMLAYARVFRGGNIEIAICNNGEKGESHEKIVRCNAWRRYSLSRALIAGHAGFRAGRLRSQWASQRLGAMRLRRSESGMVPQKNRPSRRSHAGWHASLLLMSRRGGPLRAHRVAL